MDVLILAAGMGRRFGSDEPKCLSPIHNQSVLEKLISQIEYFFPHAHIKIVLGYKAASIKEALSTNKTIAYIENEKYAQDKNIWSVILGVAATKDGVLVLEGDCVYDDLAFHEIAQSVDGTKSILFLGNVSDPQKLNAAIGVEAGLFSDFIIGKKDPSLGSNYFDMTGALWISPVDIDNFKNEAQIRALKTLDIYYFEPIFNKERFALQCKNLSGQRHTFNTQDEYNVLMDNLNQIRYFEVSDLKHIEDFSQKRVDRLAKKITKEGVWTRPICVDPFGLVMDGQHRMEVAKKLGLEKVPVMVFDYEDVEIYSLRKNYNVSIEEIRDRVAQENIYPYKTVKHKFPINIRECNIDLNLLYGN